MEILRRKRGVVTFSYLLPRKPKSRPSGDWSDGHPPVLPRPGQLHKGKIHVRGDVHTNTVESAFSLFKRGLTGAFHKVSLKHLQRYLEEFAFRFNNRKNADLFGMTVRRVALAGICLMRS